ncbi:glycosyltransferase family 2 protein [Mrakia frigida]|uniref:glycosyltransferase family 2 protein n=1 Tax=Mrakia frigida TaxID=29902 RepID=UPI003FCC1056
MRGPVSSGAGWGLARENMMKRRDVRQIELKEGNLVLDVPVPAQIVPPGNKSEEMNKMRYTAATCDPDDFQSSKYTLRPFLYGRKTELFVVMTMYNEDEILFLKTMNSVIKNITHLCDRSKSTTWGHDGWKKVVVVVVSDGRKPCNPRTLKVLQLMGAYAEGVAKDHVGDKEVTAHIFEVTTQAVVSEAGDVSIGAVPIQIIFVLKEQNKKKLNSHRWFFNALGPILKPNICILLDVGTKPSGTSIYELWKTFDKNPGVGGACGEIKVDTGRGCGNLLNPLVAAQNFEYKMSNILDKPLESVMGYISVLPGAFSAYRYAALQNDSRGKGPLASYFLGEKMHSPGANAGIFERNMYLAEDRILCFEIVTKKNEAWRLVYVKSAEAATDVPNTVPEFISQRRRWLNGSLFAAIHATIFFFKIWTSGQGFFRCITLQFEFIYMFINLVRRIADLFSLSVFFLLQSATQTTGAQDPFFGAGDIIFQVFSKLYIVVIFVILICSLGNRPQGSNVFFTGSMVLFAILQLMLLYCAGWTVYNAVPHTAAGWANILDLIADNSTFRDIVISLGATYGLYLVSSLMYLEPFHMFTSFIQYLLLLPSFVNILMIYSMCNLHDVSWGTKGSTTTGDLGSAKLTKKDGKEVMEVEVPQNKDDLSELWLQARGEIRNKPAEVPDKRAPEVKQSDNDKNYRTNVVLIFLGSNMAVILIFTSDFFLNWYVLNTTDTTVNPYLSFIFYSVAGLSAIRFIGSFFYLVLRLVGL